MAGPSNATLKTMQLLQVTLKLYMHKWFAFMHELSHENAHNANPLSYRPGYTSATESEPSRPGILDRLLTASLLSGESSSQPV